jgi:endonuclease YncB( thermonuclease family)
MRLPLPALVIGLVILFIAYGGQIFAPVPPRNAPQTGPAPASLSDVRAVDGDTLHAGSLRIRLIGIDAPEKAQTCRDARGQAYACGVAAAERLAALVAAGNVACAAQGHDRYGRTLAVCSTAEVDDVGRALVREGYAVSYMDREHRYLAAETAARDEGLGMWRGAFERPADWRKRNRPQG